MTQVKKYRIGTYIWVNGELVLKQHNRTYRGKPTKHIEEQNDSEIRRGIKFIALYILCAVSYSAITATNNIVLEVEAEGVKSADVVVEDVAPTSYEGIPYMEREEPEDFTESVWKSIGTMEISSYSEKDSCHYPTKGGCLVASGKVAKVGMVATNLYPFGTRLMIDGEIYIVEDRISKRFNNRIDIFQGYGDEAYKNAKEFGIKHLDVKVLNN